MYVEDVSMYSLRDMSDEVFNKLLEEQKFIFQTNQEAEKEAEKKRLLQIENEKKEQERIRLENIKLKKEAEEREQKAEIERKKQADILRIEQEKRKVMEIKIKEERETTAKKQAEEQAKINAEKQAKENEIREKLLAPDKMKLIDLATTIDKIILPAVQNYETGHI